MPIITHRYIPRRSCRHCGHANCIQCGTLAMTCGRFIDRRLTIALEVSVWAVLALVAAMHLIDKLWR